MHMILSARSCSEDQTFKIAFDFGQKLELNNIVCFYGDLGAGKTTFIKGLAAGAAQYPPFEINSPTFVFLNIYEGEKTIYHFDLYRMQKTEDFLNMGFDEFLENKGICCIEWAERINELIPSTAFHVKVEHTPDQARQITIFQKGN